MSLRSQAQRLRRKRWTDVNDLAQEVATILASKEAYRQIWSSDNFGPLIIERSVASDVTVGPPPNNDVRLLSARITVNLPKDSMVFFWQHAQFATITAGNSYYTYLTFDGTEAVFSRTRTDIMTSGVWEADKSGCFPLRGNANKNNMHVIDWRAHYVGGGSNAVVKKTDSRLVLLFMRLKNADVVTKL